MERIIYTTTDGNMAVVVPAPNFKGTIEDIIVKDVPSGVIHEVVPALSIPTDRTFRNAWEHDTTTAPEKVKVNMNKAKEIAHTKRRADRDEAFKPLDVQATIPSQATAAEQARQAIRGADSQKQIDIDNATTPDGLKVLMNTPLV